MTRTNCSRRRRMTASRTQPRPHPPPARYAAGRRYCPAAVAYWGQGWRQTVAVFRVASEIGGSAIVIAAFLNRRLLEPQKQRLMAQALEQGRKLGLEQGRKEERNNIREQLRRQGYNPDEMLPPPEADRK